MIVLELFFELVFIDYRCSNLALVFIDMLLEYYRNNEILHT